MLASARPIASGSRGTIAVGSTPDSRSLTSPTSTVTTGRPQAIASLTTLGEPSYKLANNRQSAAFISHGKLVLTATMDELKQRVLRFRLQYADQAPDAGQLGKVLERNGSGKLWQAIIQDPNRPAIDSLRKMDGISDFEESPLNLEEVYTALMGPK